jgi:hypothetical protein
MSARGEVSAGAHYAGSLRSRASEHSDMTLRNAITDDDENAPSWAPTADGSTSQ